MYGNVMKSIGLKRDGRIGNTQLRFQRNELDIKSDEFDGRILLRTNSNNSNMEKDCHNFSVVALNHVTGVNESYPPTLNFGNANIQVLDYMGDVKLSQVSTNGRDVQEENIFRMDENKIKSQELKSDEGIKNSNNQSVTIMEKLKLNTRSVKQIFREENNMNFHEIAKIENRFSSYAAEKYNGVGNERIITGGGCQRISDITSDFPFSETSIASGAKKNEKDLRCKEITSSLCSSFQMSQSVFNTIENVTSEDGLNLKFTERSDKCPENCGRSYNMENFGKSCSENFDKELVDENACASRECVDDTGNNENIALTDVNSKINAPNVKEVVDNIVENVMQLNNFKNKELVCLTKGYSEKNINIGNFRKNKETAKLPVSPSDMNSTIISEKPPTKAKGSTIHAGSSGHNAKFANIKPCATFVQTDPESCEMKKLLVNLKSRFSDIINKIKTQKVTPALRKDCSDYLQLVKEVSMYFRSSSSKRTMCFIQGNTSEQPKSFLPSQHEHDIAQKEKNCLDVSKAHIHSSKLERKLTDKGLARKRQRCASFETNKIENWHRSRSRKEGYLDFREKRKEHYLPKSHYSRYFDRIPQYNGLCPPEENYNIFETKNKLSREQHTFRKNYGYSKVDKHETKAFKYGKEYSSESRERRPYSSRYLRTRSTCNILNKEYHRNCKFRSPRRRPSSKTREIRPDSLNKDQSHTTAYPYNVTNNDSHRNRKSRSPRRRSALETGESKSPDSLNKVQSHGTTYPYRVTNNACHRICKSRSPRRRSFSKTRGRRPDLLHGVHSLRTLYPCNVANESHINRKSRSPRKRSSSRTRERRPDSLNKVLSDRTTYPYNVTNNGSHRNRKSRSPRRRSALETGESKSPDSVNKVQSHRTTYPYRVINNPCHRIRKSRSPRRRSFSKTRERRPDLLHGVHSLRTLYPYNVTDESHINRKYRSPRKRSSSGTRERTPDSLNTLQSPEMPYPYNATNNHINRKSRSSRRRPSSKTGVKSLGTPYPYNVTNDSHRNRKLKCPRRRSSSKTVKGRPDSLYKVQSPRAPHLYAVTNNVRHINRKYPRKRYSSNSEELRPDSPIWVESHRLKDICNESSKYNHRSSSSTQSSESVKEIIVKRKNSMKVYSTTVKEKKRARSLFHRQMDLITKYITQEDNVKRATFDSSAMKRMTNSVQNTASLTPYEKFYGVMNTLKDMESFLSFLRERKKKMPTEARKLKRTIGLPDRTTNSSDFHMKLKGIEFRVKEATLVNKNIPCKTTRSLNNSSTEESLEELERFLEKLRKRKNEGMKGTEERSVSTSETKERHLKQISRGGATPMTVLVTPVEEAECQDLHVLQSDKVEDSLNAEYKKALRKILAETKSIREFRNRLLAH